MVLLHVKGVTGRDLIVEAQAGDRIADVLHRLVTLHNCCVCISHWKEVWHECRTKHCTGVPENDFQEVERSFKAAHSLLSKEDAGRTLPLTEGALSDALEAVKRSCPRELERPLPHNHPLVSLLMGGGPAPENATGMGGRLPLLTVDNAVLWFISKPMLPDRKLCDYLGKNEKTKAKVYLQHADHGRPIMATDKDAEKAALAYYFRKQEQQKVLQAAAEGVHADNMAWAHPNALKRHLQAVSHIQLHQ